MAVPVTGSGRDRWGMNYMLGMRTQGSLLSTAHDPTFRAIKLWNYPLTNMLFKRKNKTAVLLFSLKHFIPLLRRSHP